MAILLDGQPVSSPCPPDEPLRAVLDAIRQTHAPERIIVSIEQDGILLTEEALDAALDAPLPAGCDLALRTEHPAALVARALREVAGALREGAETSIRAAELLEQGQAAEALPAVEPAVSAWRDLQQVVQQAGGLLGEPWLMQEVDGRPLHEHLAELAGRLRDLRDALVHQDAVLLADVLRYELPELAGAWATRLEELAEATEPDGA